MSTIDDCLENHANRTANPSGLGLTPAPTRQLAVVMCMDARLDTVSLLGLAEGEAHVIRNAGGVVTEEVIRSLTISQALLGTREIMLIHHTDCGMLRSTDDELKDVIEQQTGARPPFSMEAFKDLDESVRNSIARIQASPFVPHKDEIRGFVCELSTGRLREVR